MRVLQHINLVYNRYSALVVIAFFSVFAFGQRASELKDIQKGVWINLLANNSLEAWHQYLGPKETGWKLENGVLSTSGNQGDIVTDQEFTDFELEVEWKIEKMGNSGVFIYVVEKPENKYMYQTGPEFQIIDDTNYPHQLTEQQKTGALSDVIAPMSARSKPVGQWNKTKIVAYQGRVQYWLNEKLILEYALGTTLLDQQISVSKFAKLPYAKIAKGKLGIQDHGNPVYFKNIRIRVIK